MKIGDTKNTLRWKKRDGSDTFSQFTENDESCFTYRYLQ